MALVRGESPIHYAQKMTEKVRIAVNRRAPILNLLKVVFPLRGQNVPKPYERPGEWGSGRTLSELPSVIGIVEGPERTVHPSICIAR